MAIEDDIHIRRTGRAGRITLTRPKALNAMTYDMAMAIDATLSEWEEDGDIGLIVIDGEGERAFCAGGDIAELYATGKAGDYEFGRRFWADEYRLNARIAHLSIPYVAVMDGITMGGGVGISAHGSDRLVTDRSTIAMPECGIGLVPDVGGSWILGHAPGHLGEYLAITGHRMGPGDAVYAGFADMEVDPNYLDAMIAALEESGELTVLAEFARPAGPPEIEPHLDAIESHFNRETALKAVQSLEADASDWAQHTAKTIRRGCPLSVACAFEMVRRVRGFTSIEQALALEYRFTYRSMSHGDLVEGIRAQIIDKDRKPQWRISRLEDVGQKQVEAMLAPLGEDELKLAGRQIA